MSPRVLVQGWWNTNGWLKKRALRRLTVIYFELQPTKVHRDKFMMKVIQHRYLGLESALKEVHQTSISLAFIMNDFSYIRKTALEGKSQKNRTSPKQEEQQICTSDWKVDGNSVCPEGLACDLLSEAFYFFKKRRIKTSSLDQMRGIKIPLELPLLSNGFV